MLKNIKKKLMVGTISAIVLMGVVVSNKSKPVEKEIVNKTESTEIENIPTEMAPKETAIVDLSKYNNNDIKLTIEISTDISLKLSSTDDIVLTSINKSNNEVLTVKNKSLKEYLIDEDGNSLGSEDEIKVGTYYAIFEAYEIDNQPVENISINLKVRKDSIEIHNSNITYSRFGKDGHIDIKSVAPNPIDFGTKFKWEITNPTTDKKTNVKITTIDETQVLASGDINPMETINLLTDATKGTKLKVHTRQGDNTYMVKEISVDESVVKFDDVLVEYVEGDSTTYGVKLRYKIKNQNTNGVAHIVAKDAVGNNITQLSLDVNNQKVIDIDVDKGKSIIVETKMADGSYSAKKYNMPRFEEKHIGVDILELVENNGAGIRKIEIDNGVGGRTNVIVTTSDELTNIVQFDLNIGEKRVIDVNLDYVDSIMVKTKQVDGSYSSKVYNIE